MKKLAALVAMLCACLCMGGFSACKDATEESSSLTSNVTSSNNSETDSSSSSQVIFSSSEGDDSSKGEDSSSSSQETFSSSEGDDLSKGEDSSSEGETFSEESSLADLHTHAWDDGEVTTAPTCTGKGEKTYSCKCGAIKTEEISANGHTFINGVCACGKKVSQGLIYTLNEDGVSYSITDIGDCTDTDIILPSTYNNLPVTSIGDEAFVDCRSLTSIEIPNSVTSIGNGVFRYCFLLTSIIVSEDNTTYKSVDGNLYTKDGTTLMQYAIGKADTSFVIPNSVTSIGDEAFFFFGSLTSIEIPNSVTSIGNYAFTFCGSLTSIEIPNSVTSIGDYAFYACYSLQYNVEGELKYLGNENSPYLYLAGTTTDDIATATINEKCRWIGEWAFSSCSSLTSIEIPNSVTSIGEDAFSYCYSLQYNVEGELKYLGNENSPYLYLAGTTTRDITTATINEKCRWIGDEAFAYCTKLTSIEIPNSVTSIGYGAFSSCYSLTSIEIPSSVTSIGYGAFKNCTSLTSIEIPNSVTSIGGEAFSYCYLLTSITVSGDNTKYKSINGNLYTKDGNELIQYAIGKTDTSFVIPDSVTSIGDGAFYACYLLTSVEIPNSVTSIGEDAFEDCTKLTSIEIPNSVTSIGDGAFSRCSSLTSVVIGNSVTSIGDEAFSYCDSLTSIEIPDSVTSIGISAFYDCDTLTSVVIGNSVTSIGDRAFELCESLTSITFAGTRAQWNAIKKGSDWADAVPATEVICSDGTVAI